MGTILDALGSAALVEKLLSTVATWISRYDTDYDESEMVRAGVDHTIATVTKLISDGVDSGIVDQVRRLEKVVKSRSRSRSITLKRGSVRDSLGFTFRGGKDYGCGIFVSHVIDVSQAQREGLQVGDEIISVSGRGFGDLSRKEAEVLIKRQTNVTMEVRYNPAGLRASVRKRRSVPELPPSTPDASSPSLEVVDEVGRRKRSGSKGRFGLFSPFKRGSPIGSDEPLFGIQGDFDSSIHSVLKVYREGETYRYVAVTADTVVEDVVGYLARQLGLEREHYTLCIVSVEQSELLKKTALPPTMNNLGDKCFPHSRFYLKSTLRIETLLTPEAKSSLATMHDHRYFEGADPRVLAREMTLRSFSLFKSIEPLEYVA